MNKRTGPSSVETSTQSAAHLERGQHLIRFLVGTGGNGVAGVAVRVNDRVSSLPADDDGPFSPRRAVQLLHVTLLRHGGVGVIGDHGRDCAEDRGVGVRQGEWIVRCWKDDAGNGGR